jgi:hypothetical protein
MEVPHRPLRFLESSSDGELVVGGDASSPCERGGLPWRLHAIITRFGSVLMVIRRKPSCFACSTNTDTNVANASERSVVDRWSWWMVSLVQLNGMSLRAASMVAIFGAMGSIDDVNVDEGVVVVAGETPLSAGDIIIGSGVDFMCVQNGNKKSR